MIAFWGDYFITLCSQGGAELLVGDVGCMIERTWREAPKAYPSVEIDSFVVMPDHFHAIVSIAGANEGELSLGDIVSRFKTLSTHRYIEGVRKRGWTRFEKRLWQRNYFERVIRGGRELHEVQAYIENNPWALEEYWRPALK